MQPETERPYLSIVIPNYNGERLLPKFLPSVLAAIEQADAPTELVVVDDASTDRSLEMLAGFPTARVVRRERNGGFSQCCNTGIAEARGEVLLLLNSDVKLPPDFLLHYRHHFDDPQLFAITPAGFDLESGRPIDGGKLGFWRQGMPRTTKNYYEAQAEEWELTEPYPSFSVIGAYFFCDGAKLRSLGGFDPLYTPFLFEDIDLSYRALKRGWKIIYEPRLQAWHQSSSTLKRVIRPFGMRVVSVRNRMVFVLVNIHSRRMIASFWFYEVLRLLGLNVVNWAALPGLIARLPRILARRREERGHAVVTDESIFHTFDPRRLARR